MLQVNRSRYELDPQEIPTPKTLLRIYCYSAKHLSSTCKTKKICTEHELIVRPLAFESRSCRSWPIFANLLRDPLPCRLHAKATKHRVDACTATARGCASRNSGAAGFPDGVFWAPGRVGSDEELKVLHFPGKGTGQLSDREGSQRTLHHHRRCALVHCGYTVT